jgi:hypothetical protein
MFSGYEAAGEAAHRAIARQYMQTLGAPRRHCQAIQRFALPDGVFAAAAQKFPVRATNPTNQISIWLTPLGNFTVMHLVYC